MSQACQAFLMVVFAAAAASKLADRGRFEKTLQTVPWLRKRRLGLVANTVAVAELTACALLGVAPRVGAAFGCVLLVVFTAVVLSEIRGGRDFTCGCFGSESEPSGRAIVRRNACLLTVGVIALAPPDRHAGAIVAGSLAALMFLLLVRAQTTLALGRRVT
jgi:hypothetical protein